MDRDRFDILCSLCYPKWVLPRNGGDQIRGRKHGIEACLFAVIGAMCTASNDLTLEAVCNVSHGLINMEFERMLFILDEVLDELTLMDDDERKMCQGSCESDPDMIYFIDGCDFAIEEESERWMYLTHKDNIKKRTAVRAQILIDTHWGYFRGLECANVGTNPDQKMLINSVWNQPDALVSGNESVGADGGYHCTDYIKITKPFPAPIASSSEYARIFNKSFNAERALIERTFAFLKRKFQIFAQPWRRNKFLFPVALRVALKLCNRFWMEIENMPLGLQRQYDKIQTM